MLWVIVNGVPGAWPSEAEGNLFKGRKKKGTYTQDPAEIFVINAEPSLIICPYNVDAIHMQIPHIQPKHSFILFQIGFYC